MTMKPITATTKVRIDARTKIRGAARPPVIGAVCHGSLRAAAPISQVISPARRRWGITSNATHPGFTKTNLQISGPSQGRDKPSNMERYYKFSWRPKPN